MKTQNPKLIKYVSNKLLDKIAKYAMHDRENKSPGRGQDIFKPTPTPSEAEYSIKFLKLSLECLRIWGSSLDDKLSGVGRFNEKLYQLLAANVSFPDIELYNIDIQESDELQESGFVPPKLRAKRDESSSKRSKRGSEAGFGSAERRPGSREGSIGRRRSRSRGQKVGGKVRIGFATLPDTKSIRKCVFWVFGFVDLVCV